jgi:hypothetical protein
MFLGGRLQADGDVEGARQAYDRGCLAGTDESCWLAAAPIEPPTVYPHDDWDYDPQPYEPYDESLEAE